MHYPVADAHDLAPRHFGVTVSHFRRNLIDGFTDHSREMQHRSLQNFVGEK
jgi:hypothetical protein